MVLRLQGPIILVCWPFIIEKKYSAQVIEMSRDEATVVRAPSRKIGKGRLYKIVYKRFGAGQQEIRVIEEIDTETSFYAGNKIMIETRDTGDIFVTNHTIQGRIKGKLQDHS